MSLTTQEREWLFGWLQHAWETAPSTSWEPDIYGDQIDADDLRSHFIEDALKDSDIIWAAVIHWSQTERWPRLKRPTAYFLRQRLLMAQARFGMLEYPIGTRFLRAVLPQPRGTEILRFALIDDWRETGASEWTDSQLQDRSDRDAANRFHFPEDYDDFR